MTHKDKRSGLDMSSEDITKKLIEKILNDNPDEEDTFNVEDKSQHKQDKILNREYNDTNTQNYNDVNIDNNEKSVDYDIDGYEKESLDYDDEKGYTYSENYEENLIKEPSEHYVMTKNEREQQPREQQLIDKNERQTVQKNCKKNPEMMEKHMRDFFDDEEYEEYEESKSSMIGRFISTAIIIALTISTSLLVLSLRSTKIELEDAQIKIDTIISENEEARTKILEESLKNEIESLKQENEILKGEAGISEQGSVIETNASKENNTITTKAQNDSTTENTTSKPTNNGDNNIVTEYIIKEGDAVWDISKKVYGTGSKYKEILDANGLDENSVLTLGQKLIIPKIN